MTGALPVTSIGATTAEGLDRVNVPGLLTNANKQRFWVRPESGEFTRAEDLEGSILAGTPDDIVRDIDRYQEIGCDLLIFDLRMRFDDWIDQMTILAEEVLPRVASPTPA
jgi:alkanesulfonate monooxygenase SsuD/methylene tetrahydromethanopterin reductase-like flavin-dependent oxidoreductase (luciferase family)